MAYVDLNPIRAAMANTPEDSDYTSIQERIRSKDSKLLNLGFMRIIHDTYPFGAYVKIFSRKIFEANSTAI